VRLHCRFCDYTVLYHDTLPNSVREVASRVSLRHWLKVQSGLIAFPFGRARIEGRRLRARPITLPALPLAGMATSNPDRRHASPTNTEGTLPPLMHARHVEPYSQGRR
jgi:hypothetical protein